MQVMHECETTAMRTLAACPEDLGGTGVWGYLFIGVAVVGLGVGGYFLWRRMRNRYD